jgi:CRP-like cAMP-binding protein
MEEAIVKSSIVQTFEKGTILLKKGEKICKGYFVLKGCIRGFIEKNNDDITIDFFLEEDPVIPLGYGSNSYAEYSLECLEKTVAVVSTSDQEEKMLSVFPQLKMVCLTMSEIITEKLQVKIINYKTLTPEERYLHLIRKRPELIRRIPQYHIATYLGVKPESLSRIRNRIVKNRKK